jgi:tripeptidyl-peptidase-1
MINTTNSPWVHSVSYGDDENSVSLDYMKRINLEFAKFGLLGRSILFASGDDGVGCDSTVRSPFHVMSLNLQSAKYLFQIFQQVLHG